VVTLIFVCLFSRAKNLRFGATSACGAIRNHQRARSRIVVSERDPAEHCLKRKRCVGQLCLALVIVLLSLAFNRFFPGFDRWWDGWCERLAEYRRIRRRVIGFVLALAIWGRCSGTLLRNKTSRPNRSPL
jgi:hypothetical protein